MMNDPTYDELAVLQELPEELRIAVAATNRAVPDRSVESRVISTASRIAVNQPTGYVLAKVVSSEDLTPRDEHHKTTGRRKLLGALAIVMATCGVMLIPIDFDILLAGSLTKRHDVDAWVIEADIDAKQFELIDSFALAGKGCEVIYIRISHPTIELNGRLSRKEINEAAKRMRDGEMTMFVEVDQEQLSEQVRPNAEVAVKVVCGKKPLGYVCFHRLIGYYRS